nr:unnamed protein product [Callosobruchus analis]
MLLLSRQELKDEGRTAIRIPVFQQLASTSCLLQGYCDIFGKESYTSNLLSWRFNEFGSPNWNGCSEDDGILQHVSTNNDSIGSRLNHVYIKFGVAGCNLLKHTYTY